MTKLLSDGFGCPAEDATNTTTTTTTTYHVPSTTTIGFKTYFSNPSSEEHYPYYSVALVAGLAVSTLAMILSIKEPTTKIFPGHEAPSKVIASFERSNSPVMRKAQWLWESYNAWFDNNVIIGVGVYTLLYTFTLVCKRPIGAFASSCLMALLFALRMVAYPPNWINRCINKTKLKLESPRKPSEQVNDPESLPSAQKINEGETSLQVDKHKITQILSMSLNMVFTTPIYLYLLFYYYGYFVYTIYDGVLLDQNDFESPISQAYYPTMIILLGLIIADTALSVGYDFGATSDLDKANRGRRSALKATEARNKTIRRRDNAKAIKASTSSRDIGIESEHYERPAHYEGYILSNSKHQPRNRSSTTGSVVDDYECSRF